MKNLGFGSYLKNKFKRDSHTFVISPDNKNSMRGAGVIHKKKRLITHTTLHHNQSALLTFIPLQITAIACVFLLILIGIIINPLTTIIIFIAILTSIYFIDVLFNTYLILKSLHFPPELNFQSDEITKINDKTLPIYSVLCPLYREAKVLPNFLDAIDKLDWPKNKLDILLLLEENDEETINAAANLKIPSYVRVVIVPHSEPKTKPKACNYGLSLAKGEYLVIFDAEDRPEIDQLKKAYLGFLNAPKNVVCLQAKLNYYNPHQNLLTRLFTTEYSLWFDVILTGLQSINTAIPLGGTSNYFRTQALKDLKGWDPFNVTEDCDLGVRLFKAGFKTAIIDSTTWEEANSKVGNWLRQRSRWIKGYMQTYFVHNRHPLQFVAQHGLHAFIFQLIIGARMSFMLINPFLWLMTISYFALYRFVGPTIESFYPTSVFYMAAFSLVFGNFMYIYNYMIGAAKKGQWNLIKFVFLIPIYWLMASIAATIAFYQLIIKPHYWEKTVHGLNFKKEEAGFDLLGGNSDLIGAEKIALVGEKGILVSGSLLILANLLVNFSNFIINTYLGRQLSFEDYGELSLFTSFLFIASIPLSALSTTVSHKVAYLFGKYSKEKAKGYLNQTLSFSIISSLILFLFWLALIPLLINFFHYESFLPFILFAPVWVVGFLSANFGGYLQGTLSFGKLGLISIVEVLVKLALAVFLIDIGLDDWIVLIIPLSMLVSFLLTFKVVSKIKTEQIELHDLKFDKSFFTASTLLGLSTISFLGVDIIIAKHFLTPLEAGQYGIISLVGKMMFFGGSLLLPFIIPIVSKNEGAGKNSQKSFLLLLILTGLIIGISFVILGTFGNFFVPLLFGVKTISVLPYLPMYLLAIGLFTITRPVIQYYQAKKNYIFTIPGILLCGVEIILLFYFHNNLSQFVLMIFFASAINFVLTLMIYLLQKQLSIAVSNLKDLYGLISFKLARKRVSVSSVGGLRILILNWRDTKHIWSGGAESYIHELAKRWVSNGNQVTLFCGNDGKSLRNEVIDGVTVVRRGGFYTVYLWAFLYYLRHFRHCFDVIIDSENGLPFFTPLYIKSQKFLLIHHIHQDVFREHLKFPFSNIAMFLEGTIMPLVYRSQKIITVSESSKKAILRIKLGTEENIEVMNPGVELSIFSKMKKTEYPSFVYLGRLKPYKNIDIAIKAFKEVNKEYPKAIFNIAGFGESLSQLKELTRELRIQKRVKFLGKVSDKEKAELLATSWVMLQPSMIEGWGITVIEANAAGTPVIASDVAGLRDSVIDGKTGFLVKPKVIREFSEKMILLIENKKLRIKLSKEAFKWSRNFSWDNNSARFFTVIENNLDKNLISSFQSCATIAHSVEVYRK